MIELHELALAASKAMVGLLDDEALDAFDEMSAIEKVQYRYLHGDCDDFALAVYFATGWPVRAITAPAGPLHLLNESPDGRLADASGWTDLNALTARYRERELTLSEPGGEELCMSALKEAGDFKEVLAAILHLDTEPYRTSARQSFLDFADELGIWPAPPPETAREADWPCTP
jgi:hypothetical protein